MGGQPTDAPRDLKGVHEGLTDQDRTVNVPGAHGSGKPEQDSGGSSNEVMGVGGCAAGWGVERPENFLARV